MTRYAAQTDAPSDRSRAEIERTLQRYGADQFIYGWEAKQALIGFRANGKQVNFYATGLMPALLPALPAHQEDHSR